MEGEIEQLQAQAEAGDPRAWARLAAVSDDLGRVDEAVEVFSWARAIIGRARTPFRW